MSIPIHNARLAFLATLDPTDPGHLKLAQAIRSALLRVKATVRSAAPAPTIDRPRTVLF